MKYNPKAIILLDYSKELCELFYSEGQYFIFFDQKHGDQLRLKCEYGYINDFDGENFIDILSSQKIKPSLMEDYLYMLGNELKQKYISSLKITAGMHGYVFNKLGKCIIDTNKFSKHVIDEFKKYGNVFIFDFEYKKTMEKIIKATTKFIREYGGVLSGSASLAIYNYRNDLPNKFIPDDIDIYFSDHNMYKFCTEIFLVNLLPASKKYYRESPVVNEKFIFEGLKFNIILPWKKTLNPPKIELRVFDKLKNKIHKNPDFYFELPELPENNIYRNFFHIDFLEYYGDNYSKEEIGHLIQLLKEKKFKHLCGLYFGSDEPTIEEKYISLFIKDLNNSNYTKGNVDHLFEKHIKFNLKGISYFDRPSMKLKALYFSDVVSKNKKEYYEKKVSEFISNKPKIETDYSFLVECIEDHFDFEFCKLIWTPDHDFLLTKNHHSFISAKYGVCICHKNKPEEYRIEKYLSRGYKIITI